MSAMSPILSSTPVREIELFVDCWPVKDERPQPVPVETWADQALQRVAKTFGAPHYLLVPWNGASNAVGAEIEAQARASTGAVRLYCSSESVVGRAAVEVLTRYAKTVVRASR